MGSVEKKDAAIEVRDVHYTYRDGTWALRGIDLTVAKGEKLAIMGANGSGKSTLFLHLNGVLKPDKGEVILEGTPLKYSRKALVEARKKVGIVFQNPDNQLFSASVVQEISFGLLNLGYGEEETLQKVNAIMEELDMAEFREKPTHFLSGGQKKKVAIADVMVMDPEIIIFDEPTSELDPWAAALTDQIIDDLSKKGTTVILSTHNVDRALAWADRIVLLDLGKVIAEGRPKSILADKDLLKKTNLEEPKIMRIFRSLQRENILDSALEPPRTVEELEEYIEKGKREK